MRKPFQLDVFPDPCPGLFIERGPDNKGVGDWVPGVKHMLLAKYISAAYAAMKQMARACLHRPILRPRKNPGRGAVAGPRWRCRRCLEAIAGKWGAVHPHVRRRHQ
jgi:hypothetical protein